MARLVKKGKTELASELLKMYMDIWVNLIDLHSRSTLRVCDESPFFGNEDHEE